MLFKEARRTYKGLADLLLYGALVHDGVVLNKDGSLLGGWEFRGPDLSSATEEELAALAAQINRAFLALGDGWLLHADALRLPAEAYPPVGAFPDPVTFLIDEERRAQFQAEGRNFTTRYVLLLTYLPPRERETRLLRFLLEGSSDVSDTSEDLLSLFLSRLDEIEDILGPGLHLRRLDSAALLTHLHTAITGHVSPVALPPIPCYLDTVLASADLLGGMEPKIGEHHLATISLHGFPAATTTGLLEPLQHLPFSFRWSNRFVFLDAATAATHLRRFRAGWFRKRRGLSDMLRLAITPTPANGDDSKDTTFANQDALRMADDADQALAEANEGAVRFGYYTSTFLLYETDRSALVEQVRQVLRVVRGLGVTASLETHNSLEAYFGSLPGYGRPNLRRPMVHSLNLAHFLPSTSIYAGSAQCPSPLFPPGSPALLWAATDRSRSTPFRLNLHSGGDVAHTLVVGPTGAGKSAFVSLLQAQWLRYPDAQIFVFDKGYSSLPLVAAAGGTHYDVASDESLGFYPLQHVHDPGELAWAAGWLETLLGEQRVTLTPDQRNHLQRALELLAAFPPDARHLTSLSSKLQDHSLRVALQPYTLAGLFGSLFDCRHDPLTTSHFSVFEMSTLLELYQPAVTPLLLYLFHRIEERLDGRPTLIVLEEAWTFLANCLFRDRIGAWLRELRKKNAAVVFVTQSLTDLYSSPLRDVLLSSCRTKILLPNPDAASEAAALQYRTLGLNEREIEIVARAVPKREYYLTSPEGRRLLDLALGQVTLSFVGASSREDLRAIAQLRAAHGDPWPCQWLRRRNLHPQAARLAALYERGAER